MPTLLRVKLGGLEIEYQGETDFSKEDIKDLLKEVSSVKTPASLTDYQPEGAEVSENPSLDSDIDLSTETMAHKLGVKDRNDLIFAACVHLTLVRQKKTFSRIDILNEAKTATGFYNHSNHGKNLTAILSKLQKDGKLNKGTSGYAVSNNYLATARKQLAH